MVAGMTFRRRLIYREISRVLVLYYLFANATVLRHDIGHLCP
jgi:hypothetical protein